MPSLWKESNLIALEEKVQKNGVVTKEEALGLLRSFQLPLLGRLANQVRDRHWGSRRQQSTFVISSNEKNVFSPNSSTRVQTAEGFYFLRPLRSRQDWNDFQQVAQLLKAQGEELPFAAFNAEDLDFFSQLEGSSVANCVEWLKRLGVTHLGEGHVEWCSDPKQKHAISWKRWLEIHRVCHKQGLHTHAVVTLDPQIDDKTWLERLSDIKHLHSETHGFDGVSIQSSFDPRVFGRLQIPLDGFNAIRFIAVTRIYLSDIASLKLAWTAQDQKLAQVTLHFGVNDIGATWSEDIAPQERPNNGLTMPKPKDLTQMIENTGGVAQERKMMYAF
jgi:aminodeoxyfutalosine synthase